MKKGFVPTENYRRLKEAEKIVSRRGAREAGLVLIRGIYGVGKSELTERWAIDGGYIFLRAKETWTKRALLDEFADRMGLMKTGRNADVQSRVIQRLALTPVPIVIDEADHMVRTTASLLEVVRDITDLTGVMCFLVGMEKFPQTLARYGHIASRVNQVVEFEPISLADVETTLRLKSEVPIEPGVAPIVHAQCAGLMRLLLNAITNMEEWAQANGWDSIKPEYLTGKALCVEFKAVQLGRRK